LGKDVSKDIEVEKVDAEHFCDHPVLPVPQEKDAISSSPPSRRGIK